MTTFGKEAVLFANDAFYTAFATRDISAMGLVWSERPMITCIHPGWAPLLGRDEVMQSWQAILGGENAPAIVCVSPSVHLVELFAYVLCYERLPGGFLIATNIFAREAAGWRMVHHQAGPTQPPDESEAEADAPLLQ